MSSNISKLKNIIKNINLAESELESVLSTLGVGHGINLDLKSAKSKALNLIESLKIEGNEDTLNAKKLKKVLVSELRASGKTITLKKMEIADLATSIKNLKNAYKKETSNKSSYSTGSELQSSIKKLSNMCAKKHQELQNLKMKHLESKKEHKAN